MMKPLIALFFAVAVAGVVISRAAEPEKQSLRVLYVGGSVDWPGDDSDVDMPQDPPPDDPRVIARMKAFEQMLGRYFTSVKAIHANDYRQEVSADYDVTILDGTPPEREPSRDQRDASGRITDQFAARYFTEDFDRPVVAIGELGDKLGRRVGVKFDSYCLCLDAHAHSFRAGHPIFNGPFPVTLTIEELPTPESAFRYEYFRDDPTPKTIPMWRVQTKGYKSDEGFRIGMVARPWGFEDSPDAEYISSGVSSKTLDAVAIGRHGNYFGWGFAASPEYLTPEAQTVFANAVCYIAKFDGQGLIARKYHDRRATKDWIKELKYAATREYFDSSVITNAAHNVRMAEMKKNAEAKQARGEKLSYMEGIALTYNPPPQPTFEQYLVGSRSHAELFKQHGTDIAAYHRYYDENFPSFFSVAPFYKIVVDEDVKSLGIPNTDHRLLARAIELWEQGVDIDRSKRILSRYTLLNYATSQEWRGWYEANRDRLFFTQTGGFIFMVNTRDPQVPGNDYGQKALLDAYSAVAPGDTDDQNPVAVATGVVDKGNGRKDLVVKVRIHSGYHIYAHVGPGEAFTPTQLKFELPPGYTRNGELKLPPFRPYNESGTIGLYTGEVVFTQEIVGSGAGEAKLTLKYQCCDSYVCLSPVEQTLHFKLM